MKLTIKNINKSFGYEAVKKIDGGKWIIYFLNEEWDETSVVKNCSEIVILLVMDMVQNKLNMPYSSKKLNKRQIKKFYNKALMICEITDEPNYGYEILNEVIKDINLLNFPSVRKQKLKTFW